MADATNIEWTDTTWNVVRGCSRVSAGCVHCYAERQAIRQVNGGYAGLVRISKTKDGKREPRWTGEVRLVAEKLDEPLRWRAPRLVFVNSMSDLFHERLDDGDVARVFGAMAKAPQHTFQVLTKRGERMRDFVRAIARTNVDPAGVCIEQAFGPQHFATRSPDWPLPNVWLGVSVENQAAADERIPLLLETPAALRFLSVEPLLGPVDLSKYMPRLHRDAGGVAQRGLVQETGIRWVIVGGESGPGARPCDVAWIRSVVEQCRAAGVACFVKQLGADVRARKGGDMSEWPPDLRVREFPEARP